MKHSRLLRRLDSAIASETLSLEADCLRAERALYLARLGHRKEAAEITTALHARYDKSPSAKISSWLNLVEGLVIYFDDMGGGAHDKVKRSYALSAAAGLKPLHALSAAWLAQLDYMRHDVSAMARHLREALEIADADDHGTHSRASLVAAQALSHAGQQDLAMMWHKKAHEHSTKEGDEATVSALIHNMAWLRMLIWRQKILRQQDDSDERRHVLMSSESTDHFDEMVGSSSLPVLHPLLRAQILSLQDRPEDALVIYAEHLNDAQKLDAARLQGNLLADQAWCHLQLGDTENAIKYSELAARSITPVTHVDDSAATHSRLAQIYLSLGMGELEAHHRKLAHRDWEVNDQLQARVVELIGSLHNEAFGADRQPLTPPSAPTPPARIFPPPAPESVP